MGVLSILQQIKTLMDLGLTLHQSKVYCSLVENGPSNVEILAKNSKISRADVYRTVKKLTNLGIIECEISKPRTYKALCPKVVINTLLDASRKNFERKKTLSLNLLKDFEEKPKNKVKTEKDVIFVSSNHAVIDNVKKAIKKTSNSIDVLTTSGRLTQACYLFSSSFQEALARNVKGRILVSKANENHVELFQKVLAEPLCEIRVLKSKPNVLLAIYDQKIVEIITDSSSAIKDSTCLWSNNRSIVLLAKQYFECNWDKNNGHSESFSKNKLTK